MSSGNTLSMADCVASFQKTGVPQKMLRELHNFVTKNQAGMTQEQSAVITTLITMMSGSQSSENKEQSPPPTVPEAVAQTQPATEKHVPVAAEEPTPTEPVDGGMLRATIDRVIELIPRNQVFLRAAVKYLGNKMIENVDALKKIGEDDTATEKKTFSGRAMKTFGKVKERMGAEFKGRWDMRKNPVAQDEHTQPAADEEAPEMPTARERPSQPAPQTQPPPSKENGGAQSEKHTEAKQGTSEEINQQYAEYQRQYQQAQLLLFQQQLQQQLVMQRAQTQIRMNTAATALATDTINSMLGGPRINVGVPRTGRVIYKRWY